MNFLRASIILTLFIALFANSPASIGDGTLALDSENSCTVTVYRSSGSLARNVKVSTDVSGGISCVGGRAFYTDDDGEATLKWSDGCYLRTVYVNGEAYSVDYRDGESYELRMD